MKKTFIINGEEVAVENLSIYHGEVRFTVDGIAYHFSANNVDNGHFVLRHNGRNREGYIGQRDSKGCHPIFLHGGVEASIEQKGATRSRGEAAGKAVAHTAPMPGTIQKVLVQQGDVVVAGQPLVVMEAMKLQLNIEAAYDGRVEELCCEPGGLVSEGTLLVKVAADESGSASEATAAKDADGSLS